MKKNLKSPFNPPPRNGPKKEFPWVIAERTRQEIRQRLIAEWSARPIVDQAKSEGWYEGIYGLRAYIAEHADFEAQCQSGALNKGYAGWAWGYNTWNERGEKIDLNQKLTPKVIAWMKSRGEK